MEKFYPLPEVINQEKIRYTITLIWKYLLINKSIEYLPKSETSETPLDREKKPLKRQLIKDNRENVVRARQSQKTILNDKLMAKIIKEQFDLDMAEDFVKKFEYLTLGILEIACENALENGRKTLKERDLR